MDCTAGLEVSRGDTKQDSIIIIIIIIIIDIITLLSNYLLGNLHLSHTVGGIRLSQGKEINPNH